MKSTIIPLSLFVLIVSLILFACNKENSNENITPNESIAKTAATTYVLGVTPLPFDTTNAVHIEALRDDAHANHSRSSTWTSYYSNSSATVTANSSRTFYLNPTSNYQYNFVVTQVGKSFGVDIYADLNGTLNLVQSYSSTNGTLEARFTTQDTKYGGRFVCVLYAGSSGLNANVQINWRTRQNSYSANMVNYLNVYQRRVPTNWNSESQYSNLTASCLYPIYNGSMTMDTQNTEICGVAAYLMARNLVNKPTQLALSANADIRAKQMVEAVMRTRKVAGITGYSGFGVMALRDIARGTAGTSGKKGDFTTWGTNGICGNYYEDCNGSASLTDSDVCKAEVVATTSYTTASSTIETALTNRFPLVAVINAKVKYCPNGIPTTEDYFAYLKNYTSTTYFGGHMVTIVGVDITYDGYRHIYFVDPLKGGNQIWWAPQDVFFDAMRRGSSSGNTYNLLVVKGL